MQRDGMGSSVPAAYGRVLVFGLDGALLLDEIAPVSAASGSYQPLQTGWVEVPEGGAYAACYVANESNMLVFFDDVRIRREGIRTQENHYYPFGLNIAALRKDGAPDDKFQYNGKELQEEHGLLWNDYGARFYDPALGRWHCVDPLAERRIEHSPYQYVLNNPLLRIDPDGKTDYTFDKKTGVFTQVGEANDEPDRILKTNRKGEIKYNKKGDAKVEMIVGRGILSDGLDLKNRTNIFEIGGEGQATMREFENFAYFISKEVDTEMSGSYWVQEGSDEVARATLQPYVNHTSTESTVLDIFQLAIDGAVYDKKADFHTHPVKGSGGYQHNLNPSSRDIEARETIKARTGYNGHKFYIIGTGPSINPNKENYTTRTDYTDCDVCHGN